MNYFNSDLCYLLSYLRLLVKGVDVNNKISGEGIDPDFKLYYEAMILPHLQEAENLRIQALLQLRRYTLNAVIGTSIALLFIYNIFEPPHTIAMAFLALIVFIYIGLPIVKYETKVKSIIYPILFNYFGDGFTYNIEGIPSTYFGIARQPQDNTKNNNSDYIQGSYKNVTIEIMKLKVVENAKGAYTHFNGIAIRLSANKMFQGKTLILHQTEIRNTLFSDFLTDHGTRVELEDPQFNKVFTVYSSDQVEARYLLTPSFMENLLSLVTLFNTAGIQGFFADNHLVLTIPSSKIHWLENPSMFKPANFVESCNLILQQMKIIFHIIDVLKFDEHTRL